MDGPSTCASCGAQLGSGRFCTNCGARVEPSGPGGAQSNPGAPPDPGDTSTHERVYDLPEEPPATPRAPQPAVTEPVRRAPPLFRDEVYPPSPPATPYPAPLPPEPAYAQPSPTESATHRRSSGIGWWIAAVVGLLTVLVIGAVLLLSGGNDGPSSASSPSIPPNHPPSSAPPSAQSSAQSSAPSTTSSSAAATDVAGLSTASAPAHAPPGVDFSGQTVTYVAPNMVDGIADTCWRTPGDATHMVLTLRLDQPTKITKVGLINGYAKTAVSGGRTYDWYRGDRRVLAVTWLFDDGSSVSQTFAQTPTMQSRSVPPVTTSTVRIEITAVSPPGRGPAARNDTAISEVSMIGSPG